MGRAKGVCRHCLKWFQVSNTGRHEDMVRKLATTGANTLVCAATNSQKGAGAYCRKMAAASEDERMSDAEYAANRAELNSRMLIILDAGLRKGGLRVPSGEVSFALFVLVVVRL